MITLRLLWRSDGYVSSVDVGHWHGAWDRSGTTTLQPLSAGRVTGVREDEADERRIWPTLLTLILNPCRTSWRRKESDRDRATLAGASVREMVIKLLRGEARARDGAHLRWPEVDPSLRRQVWREENRQHDEQYDHLLSNLRVAVPVEVTTLTAA